MESAFGVAIAQLNFVVGDIRANTQRIIDTAIQARDELNCRFIIYPELAISGYPPEDLLERKPFVHDCETALQDIADAISGIAVVAGHPQRTDSGLYNAASLIDDGKILGTYHKHHLPNYGVFDEKRYFKPGESTCILQIEGVSVGLTICEDVWEQGPVEWAVRDGAQLIFTLNGSPFDVDKVAYRENEVVSRRSQQNQVGIVYVNLVGGQDELVFDGGSLVTDSKGQIICRAPYFEEAVVRTEFSLDGDVKVYPGKVVPTPDRLTAVYSAIRLGVADYIGKNGFSGAVVGVSGGIDSALTLAVVADAIGPENVEAVLMPSRHTQPMSIEDAQSEAEALGVPWSIVSIEPIYQAALDQLAPAFGGYDIDVTEENLQARCRGMILMAISNKKGKIVVTTGNKSEVAVGYATLYGDMAGGFSAIKDVPKMMVYELAHYRNLTFGEVIPARVFERPPSAELAEGQRDDDLLPPYDVLDEIVRRYVEDGKSVQDISSDGFDDALVERIVTMVNRSEYKRRQAAPGVRISPKAFGRDRRYPISGRY